MKEQQILKQYTTQLTKLQNELQGKKLEITNLQKDFELKKKQISDLEKKIKNIKTDSKIRVSEHAIVRYFERVKGFNLSEIEKEIVNEEVLKMVETLGNGTYPNNNGYTITIKNNVVVTLIT